MTVCQRSYPPSALLLNTAKCSKRQDRRQPSNFGRELRSPSEVYDIRVVIQNDNFVPEITPSSQEIC
ncbi:hypothetical protein TNCV_3823361 [Trichonephila clavipes]|nr:hypothetical protein TNCV_3823361 [Trichonephila clavipes]